MVVIYLHDFKSAFINYYDYVGVGEQGWLGKSTYMFSGNDSTWAPYLDLTMDYIKKSVKIENSKVELLSGKFEIYT